MLMQMRSYVSTRTWRMTSVQWVIPKVGAVILRWRSTRLVWFHKLKNSDPNWDWFDSFFFQAEDGIRDVAVTGVQTCALPISPLPSQTTPSVPGRCRASDQHRPGTLGVVWDGSAGGGRAAIEGDSVPGHSARGRMEIGRASCRERV